MTFQALLATKANDKIRQNIRVTTRNQEEP